MMGQPLRLIIYLLLLLNASISFHIYYIAFVLSNLLGMHLQQCYIDFSEVWYVSDLCELAVC